eukprot:UN01405
MGCVQSQESSGSSSSPKSGGNTIFNSVDDMPGVPKKVFLEWEVEKRGGGGWEKLGRMEITLFSNTPKTSTNFGAICNGIKAPPGLTNSKGTPINVLKYEGHESHRIIPGFMCQFGDITEWNTRPGTGGCSAFGTKRFDDENFINTFPQHRIGCLSMANAGPNTNGSQVFLCTSPCQHLYRKHVVFGQADEESLDVVKKMESYGSSSGAPKSRIRCSAAGILEYYTEAELAAVDPKKDQTRQ